MGLFAAAWLFGEGLIVWRWAKNHAPPTPGALLLPSAFFLALAVLAQYAPARATATALAWGVDLAVVLQVVGKNPGVQTGWPPGHIPDTQIWPGGATAAAGGGGASAGGGFGGTAVGAAIAQGAGQAAAALKPQPKPRPQPTRGAA